MNPYRTLGIQPTASEAEIKRAYFQKVKEFPPERHPEDFKRIREAYEQLRTPEARVQVELLSFSEPPEELRLDPSALPPLDLEPALALLLEGVKEACPEWRRRDLSDVFTEVTE